MHAFPGCPDFASNMFGGMDLPVAIPIERWDVENLAASTEAVQVGHSHLS